jgi:prepilin peptidase CpaA
MSVSVPQHRLIDSLPANPWFWAWTAPWLLAMPWWYAASGVNLPAPVQGLSGLVLTLLLVTASGTDLAARRIRNWTTYPAMTYALALNALASLSLRQEWSQLAALCGGVGFTESALGGILCFSGAFTMFLVFAGGAGDVKLMAAIGALVGWRDGFQIWLCTMLFAAAFSLAYAAWRTGWRSLVGFCMRLFGDAGTVVQARLGDAGSNVESVLRQHLPMAPFYSLGVIVVLTVPQLFPGKTFVALLVDWL